VSGELATLRRAVSLQAQLREAAREGLGPSGLVAALGDVLGAQVLFEHVDRSPIATSPEEGFDLAFLDVEGDVLELAYGTGEWTIRLAEVATSVVGVDAAPEMRELALAKLQDAGKSNVELWVDDLFSWQPDQDYDVVFFAFWLSHVPESHTDRFWRSVQSCRPRLTKPPAAQARTFQATWLATPRLPRSTPPCAERGDAAREGGTPP